MLVSVLLPSLHLGEIHSHQSVGHGLLVQVAAVPSEEGRHVVTCEKGPVLTVIYVHLWKRQSSVRRLEGALPCRAPLSRKLCRLKRVFLEARYWMKRCKEGDGEEERAW